MQTKHNYKPYYLRADAHAVGGFLREPVDKVLPVVAPVSLPAVGGFNTARSGVFNCDELISCSAAYSRVSGHQHPDTGAVSIQITSVVEDLNILEVVRAERIATQISLEIASGNESREVSLAGSGIEGLWLAGRHCRPTLKADFMRPSRVQDRSVIRSCWDGLESSATRDALGALFDLPGFGRFYFGEFIVGSDSVQLLGLRADLGCPVKGKVVIAAGGGGGTGDNHN